MSNFDDEMMKGFTEQASAFDKWCEKAYPILGKVTQCGIWETDSKGGGFFATNRPDYGEEYLCEKGYLIDPFYAYVVNFEDSKLETNKADLLKEGYFDLNIECPYLDIGYVVTYKERIDENTIRTYGFASDTPRIHDALVNNLNIFKKFLSYFKSENANTIKFINDHKVDFTTVKDDFFVKNEYIELSDRQKLNALLTSVGALQNGSKITHREWQCAMLFTRGMSASKTGDILGISQRTVEGHFDSLKTKLGVRTKVEVLDSLN
jgi:DNA-binding CsgD family transcriptional regulator